MRFFNRQKLRAGIQGLESFNRVVSKYDPTIKNVLGIVGLCILVFQLDSAQSQLKEQTNLATDELLVNQSREHSISRTKAIEAVGEDFSDRSLKYIDLSNSNLEKCNFSKSRLDDSTFQHSKLLNANFSESSLRWVDFEFADLTGANFSDSDLYCADLRATTLSSIRNWKSIRNIELANIYNVSNPPEGFIQWARINGAVDIADDLTWRALTDSARTVVN